jgi:hypothetical protein
VAQLAPPQQAKIDREIEHALRAWSQLPEVEAAFGNWPEDTVLDFIFEWTLEEDRLQRLDGHARRGEMTAQQQKRYERLVQTVREHRPIVDRLIDG